jgi:tetratricopeptide (TPR) repeat protein
MSTDPEPGTVDTTRRQAMTLYQQGSACQSGGQIEPAEDYYRAALAADPGCAPAWLGLGEVCKKRGRTEEARVALQRFTALADDPARIAAAQALLAELDGRPYKRCSRCGSFSTLGRYYRRTTTGQDVCPRCVLQEQQRDLRQLLWMMAAIAAIGGLTFLLLGPAGLALLWLPGHPAPPGTRLPPPELFAEAKDEPQGEE